MDKKIIFVDLDETLLNTDKTICQANKDAIQEMVNAGHYFAVNTGRPLNGAQKIVSSLNMGKNCFILTFHGTCVYDCSKKEIVHVKSIPSKDAIELMNEIDKFGIYTQTFTEKRIYTKHNNATLAKYNEVTNEPFTLIEDYEELQDKALSKVMAIDYESTGKLVEFQKYYKDKENGKFTSFFSCDEFLEYTLEGADKGYGVRFLADYLGVPIENTIAVGDEGNDISMIKAAGVGVAMVNGATQAKQVANYVTTRTNNEGGVAEVIEKFILQ